MIKQCKITGYDDEFEYKVDFANMIRNLKEHLYKMVINPIKENIRFLTSWIIKESCLEPNKIKKIENIPYIKSIKAINMADLMPKCDEILSKKNDEIIKSPTLEKSKLKDKLEQSYNLIFIYLLI